MANRNLSKAKVAKNDEFYTQISDIENEMKHYRPHFKGQTIFMNCDDPEWSNFWKFFHNNFEFFGLKKIISTHYESDKKSYKLEYDGKEIVKTDLLQNGDFRSPESVELLKEADIVITNPPFSLFREYMAQLMKYNKRFLIIGNKNAIATKDIFPYVKDNRLWLGLTSPKEFIRPDGELTKKVQGLCRWFTNLTHNRTNEVLSLARSINDGEVTYPKYENYDAINVDKMTDIPNDYYGVMGVPVTFLDKYNPEQFEIVELGIVGSCNFTSNRKMEILRNGVPTGKFTHNAKGTLYRKYNPEQDTKAPAFKDCITGELYSSIYTRVLIKRRENENK